MNRIKLLYHIAKNMGVEYVFFRGQYELRRKMGLLKGQYPTAMDVAQNYIDLEYWRNIANPFFFDNIKSIGVERNQDPDLKEKVSRLRNGVFTYFSSTEFNLGKDIDWCKNVLTGYRYPHNVHWTDISDIDNEAGDIKYVWDLSRFVWLYDIIRYDYHFSDDQSKWVFDLIEDWIDKNPLNCGPNYKCSQEIALRVLNWIFALYYFRSSSNLTPEVFNKIINSIRWQIKHVYSNINFSRKTVRNNHALTETLSLYLVGLLFPFFPESEEWKSKGRNWFEQEVMYQIYPDGCHLLFSNNYQRVVIQLMTWGLILSSRNNEAFSDEIYKRVQSSVDYLYQIHNLEDGRVPNYGPNDGSLNCKLNSAPYYDFRPQLNALYFHLTGDLLFNTDESIEETCWLNNGFRDFQKQPTNKLNTINCFEHGGCYTIRDSDSFLSIKCTEYKDRPSHSDNFHIDLWYKGVNILRDAGTYLYNTDEALVKYFNSSRSHNTVTLGDYDHMLKGPRFIWLYWPIINNAEIQEKDDYYLFSGEIKCYDYLEKGITCLRTITQYKNTPKWIIQDRINHNTGLPVKQYWNINKGFLNDFKVESIDGSGDSIDYSIDKGLYSEYYGVKVNTEVLVIESTTNTICTTISIK